jgi:riboflavin kinase/FMN adenylyltransferase
VKVYHSIDQFPLDIKSVLTLGTFDGVHKGHKYVLKRMNEIAKKEGVESVLLLFILTQGMFCSQRIRN